MIARKKYRLLAFIIDVIICFTVIALLTIVFIPFSTLSNVFHNEPNTLYTFNMYRILELGVCWETFLVLYLSVIPSMNKGQTLGMKASRIKMVSSNDKDCTFGQYFTWGLICNTLLVIFTFGLYFIVNLAVLLYRNDELSLNNIICGTKIIDKLDY